MQTASFYARPRTATCDIKNELRRLGQLLAPARYNDRIELLNELLDSCSAGKAADSEKMLGYLIASNLLRRFQGTGISENLYDTTDGVSQIRLFDILIHQFPFVRNSQEISNKAILRMLHGKQEACIVDIGIGLGTQMLHVLQQAAGIPTLKKLTIVGIEPFENALETAGDRIRSFGNMLPFELEFVPVPQYIEETDLARYVPLDTPVIVNASLALHHIKSDADRNRVIGAVRALKPAGFLLIEPCVDHFTDDLADRIVNTFEHFSAVFRIIDRLDASVEDKNGLKQFFGRELEDILSKADDSERFEKHEPVSAWMTRLRRHGFTTDTRLLLQEEQDVLGVRIRPASEGYVIFEEASEPMLAVMLAC